MVAHYVIILSITHPTLAKLQTALVLAILQQLHGAFLQRSMASNFTNHLTNELHVLTQFLHNQKKTIHQPTLGNPRKICQKIRMIQSSTKTTNPLARSRARGKLTLLHQETFLQTNRQSSCVESAYHAKLPKVLVN